MLKLYTAADIAEMTTLADEARALDAEFRELMAQVVVATEPYDNGTGLWAAYTAECPELAPLAAALDYERVYFSPAPFQKLGSGVYEGAPIQAKQNAAEWRRLNSRTRRELAALRKALAALPLPDDLLTPAEAAALAGVQPATLKQWVRRGKIKPAKEWGEGKNTRRLFWRKDVEALVTGAALARPGGEPAREGEGL